MSMLTVNGMAVPAPSQMKVTIFDVSSGVSRSACGDAIVDRVGVKRRLALSWAHMTGEQLSALLEIVGAGGFFTVTYPDPENGNMRTASCYCSDRVAGILRMAQGMPVWTNIEMTWTER